jgi:lipoate-protein ligase A
MTRLNDYPEWRVLDTGAGSPEFNMALDEALLEMSATVRKSFLRFYSWKTSPATFGYSQQYETVAQLTALRPLIRRCTGGGLVPHEADWTYSVAIPRATDWYRLNGHSSYLRTHQWLQKSFLLLGLPTELAQAPDTSGPGQCFVGAETSDLLYRGRKIAGAAQRRSRHGLLIEGSIQPIPSEIRRDAWQSAMMEVIKRSGGEVGSAVVSDFPGLAARAFELCQLKYAQPSYNQRR